jgi:hypothetical protein
VIFFGVPRDGKKSKNLNPAVSVVGERKRMSDGRKKLKEDLKCMREGEEGFGELCENNQVIVKWFVESGGAWMEWKRMSWD